MPCIPPESAVSEKRFPPKTFSGPPEGGSICRHTSDHLSCRGSSPDSVISRVRTAYAGERIAPLSLYTIPRFTRRSKRKRRVSKRKNRLRTHFSRDGQICCTSFAEKQMAHQRRTFPETHEIREKRLFEKTAPGDEPRMRLDIDHISLLRPDNRAAGRKTLMLISA